MLQIGDVVMVQCRHNKDMSFSGVVTESETDFMWAKARTIWTNDFLLDGDKYDISLIRRVEPETVGSTITLDGITYTKWTNHDYRTNQWISESGETYSWSDLMELF